MKIVLLVVIAMVVCVTAKPKCKGKNGKTYILGTGHGPKRGYKDGCFWYECHCTCRKIKKGGKPQGRCINSRTKGICTKSRMEEKNICEGEDTPWGWSISWSGGSGSYYDRPAETSEDAHEVCENDGGVVTELNSQNELDALLQYAGANLHGSNAICESSTQQRGNRVSRKKRSRRPRAQKFAADNNVSILAVMKF